MQRGTAVAAIIVVAVLGFVGGYVLGGYDGTLTEGAPPGERGSGRFDSSILPLGGAPGTGAEDAAVTMVFFADFANPSSAAAATLIQGVIDDERRADDLRLVVKVLPGRRDESQAAAAAVLYAAENGALWDGVYERLVAIDEPLGEEALNEVLSASGLDVDEFRAAYDAGRYAALIDADVNLARAFLLSRAPAVFVNGRFLTGDDLDADALSGAVEAELEAVAELGAAISADRVYGLRVLENAEQHSIMARRGREARERQSERAGLDERGGEREAVRERPEPREEQAAEARPEPPRREAQPPAGDVERMRIAVGDSYVHGPDDALVTIIEFTDFHCPFCGRAANTVDQLIDEYGDDIRVVFKHNPLPQLHPQAPMAHQASLAAGEQGKFWEMHDLIFANQRARSMEELQGHAEALGLDIDAFVAYVEAERGQETITADQAAAARAGARGTPHFFINGRRIRGAQPIESFREVIDSELALARQLLQEGVAREEVYDHLMEDAQDEMAAERPQEPTIVDPPDIGASATRGPEDAAITIYTFSEFQCPFSGRVQATLQQIDAEYGDQVRWVFKAFPLPFHADADLAAQASLAANEQQKFWEYHDLLFQNQQALSRADLERYAEQLGLDMDRFRDALDSGRFAEQVNQEREEARRAGVSGTPTFLIDGERLVGAQPYEQFRTVIERHLND